MNKIAMCAMALLMMSLAGCVYYTAVTIDKDKAYIAGHRSVFIPIKQIYVCNVASDGMLENCKAAK